MVKAIQLFLVACLLTSLNGCASNHRAGKNSSQLQVRAYQLTDEEKQMQQLQGDISARFCEMEVLARVIRKLHVELEAGPLYNHASIKTLVADGEGRKNLILSDQAYLEGLKAFNLVVSNRVQALKTEYVPYKDEAGCHLGSHSITNDSKH